MELDVPIAISMQLVSFPDDERQSVLSDLRQLAEHPERLDGVATRHEPPDADLWTVRLSPQMRALVRTEGGRLRVLAVAPLEQLLPYLETDGKQAA